MNLGEKIRKLRKEKNLTLEEISKKTGLSLSYISLIERGLKNPSLKALEKIAKCFEIPVSSLLSNQDEIEDSLEIFLRTKTKLTPEEREMIIKLIRSLEKKENV